MTERSQILRRLRRTSLAFAITAAGIALVAGYTADKERRDTINARCELVSSQVSWNQLKQCNRWLNTDRNGICILRRDDIEVDYSCRNPKEIKRAFDECIRDQGFWGKAIEQEEGDGFRVLGAGGYVELGETAHALPEGKTTNCRSD